MLLLWPGTARQDFDEVRLGPRYQARTVATNADIFILCMVWGQNAGADIFTDVCLKHGNVMETDTVTAHALGTVHDDASAGTPHMTCAATTFSQGNVPRQSVVSIWCAGRARTQFSRLWTPLTSVSEPCVVTWRGCTYRQGCSVSVWAVTGDKYVVGPCLIRPGLCEVWGTVNTRLLWLVNGRIRVPEHVTSALLCSDRTSRPVDWAWGSDRLASVSSRSDPSPIFLFMGMRVKKSLCHVSTGSGRSSKSCPTCTSSFLRGLNSTSLWAVCADGGRGHFECLMWLCAVHSVRWQDPTTRSEKYEKISTLLCGGWKVPQRT